MCLSKEWILVCGEEAGMKLLFFKRIDIIVGGNEIKCARHFIKKSSHRYDFCNCQGNPWYDICPEYLVLFALPLFCLSFSFCV